MAAVALRAGRLITRSPNSGFGTGRAPAPSAPMPIIRAPVSPSRRGIRAGSRIVEDPSAGSPTCGAGSAGGGVPSPTRDMSAG